MANSFLFMKVPLKGFLLFYFPLLPQENDINAFNINALIIIRGDGRLVNMQNVDFSPREKEFFINFAAAGIFAEKTEYIF